MAGSADGIRAGRAFVELAGEDKGLQGVLDRVASKMTAVGGALRNAGAWIGGFGASITAPIAAAAYAAAESGAAIYDMSRRTGASVAALSMLGYAAERTGGDLATVENAFRRMQKTISGVKDDVEGTSGELGHLGIRMDEIRGLAPEKQFDIIADRIAGIADPTARANAAMKVFGRTGTVLLPMIENLSNLKQEAKELGYVRTGQSAKEMKDFSLAMLDATKASKSLWSALGTAVVPVLKAKTQAITAVVLKIRDWAREHKPLVAAVFQLGVGLTALGGALVAGGIGFTLMGTAVGGLLTPVRLIGGLLTSGVTLPLRAAGFAGGVAFDLLRLGASKVLPVLAGIGQATLFLLNPFQLLPGLARGVIGAFSLVGSTIAGAFTSVLGAGAAVASVLTPVVLVGAAVVLIGGYLLYTSGIAGQAFGLIRSLASAAGGRIVGVFSAVAARLKTVWATIRQDAGVAFDGVRNALAAGNWALAGQIIWTTLRLEFARGVDGIWSPLLTSFYNVKAALLDAWASTMAGLQALWADAKEYLTSWDGIKTAAMKFVTWLGNAWSSMMTYLTDKFTNMMISGDIERRASEIRARMEGEGKSEDEIASYLKDFTDRMQSGQDDYVKKTRRDRDLKSDTDYSAKQKAYDVDFASKQPANASEGEAARARIESTRLKALADNAAQLQKALDGIDPGNKARIESLKQQLATLAATAKDGNYAGPTNGSAGREKRPRADTEEAMDTAIKSFGTFNKSALFGLAGDNVEQIRIRKAAESTAKNLDVIRRQKAGLKFT